MRKYMIPVLLGVCLGLLPLQAQFRLSSLRNAYQASDHLVKQQVEYKDPGSKGQQLTWDFRMIQPKKEEYSLKYFIPDSTDMTRLCGMEHATRYYYRQQHDSLLSLGFENSTTWMEYTVPELRMHFPFGYGDTLFSRFEGRGQYSHRFNYRVKGYTRVQADARGELQLPRGETVKNALRVRTLRHYTETGHDSIEMSHEIYSWYAEGIRYPVFESIKTTVSKKGSPKDADGESLKDSTVYTTSFYYPPELQTSQVTTEPPVEEQSTQTTGAAAVFTEGRFMPNPVSTNLYINYKLTRGARIWFSLHNNIGIPMVTTAPESQTEGFHNLTLNMASMITGTYTLYVHVDDMVMRQVIIRR